MTDKIAENRKWLYLVAMVAACLPLTFGYLVERGELLNWANRVMELAAELPRLTLFPKTGEIDTNLYLLLPAVLYRLTKSIVLSYIVAMALLQLITGAGIYLLMNRLYQEPLAVLLGATLYLLCPYRLHLCYERGDLVLCAVWALVPWYLYGLHRSGRTAWISAVALAVIGYGSSVMLILLLAFTVIWFFICPRAEKGRGIVRVLSGILPIAGGVLLWLPQGIRFFKYLFTGALDGLEITVSSIAVKGYAVSDYMTMWRFREGKPGFGLGLLLAVVLFFWLLLIRGEKTAKENKLLGALVLICLWAANHYFPWDMMQRMGGGFLKLVSLMDTPALFFGFASLFLSLLVPSVVKPLLAEKEALPARGSLLIVWLAAVGSAILYCNGFT